MAASKGVGPGHAQGRQSQNFLKLVERTTEAFVSDDDTDLEEVRRTLKQVRRQYDSVHHEAEQKEAQLRRVKEDIRTLDLVHSQKTDVAHSLDGTCQELEQQYNTTWQLICEAKTSRKVYEHMLARIQKEQAILKEKMLKMEDHLGRKGRERQRKIAESERSHAASVVNVKELETLESDAAVEREACRKARQAMQAELTRRREANKRRADFESWRHEVALEAANDAFNASAGRLRKLYAIEKLAGNCLQKITFEQVDRAQNTEDGFQKIRDVTGLADVMDIVHKFLNRDVEHEQLRGSVKDAEELLGSLRQAFDARKRDTEGITFDSGGGGRSGEMYKAIEHSERELNDAMEEHELCRMRLQKTTLQVEHIKRWAARVGAMLSLIDDPVKIDSPEDFAPFFRKLHLSLEKFVGHVGQQIRDQKINRKTLVQVLTRECHEHERLLSNEGFLRANCRVPAVADGRSTSRQGSVDDDPTTSFEEERERLKQESKNEVDRAMQAEQQRKKTKGS